MIVSQKLIGLISSTKGPNFEVLWLNHVLEWMHKTSKLFVNEIEPIKFWFMITRFLFIVKHTVFQGFPLWSCPLMVSRKYQNMKKIPKMVYIKPCVEKQCPLPSDIPTVLIFFLTHILLNEMAPEEICLTALLAFQWFFVFTEIIPMKCQTSFFKKELFFPRDLLVDVTWRLNF